MNYKKFLLIVICAVGVVLLLYSITGLLWGVPAPLITTTLAASTTPIPQFDTSAMLQKDFQINGRWSQGTRIIDLELGIVCYADGYGLACVNLTPEQLSKIGDR